MIVCKFGGSATTSELALKNVKKICKNKNRNIFVFSAVGKTNKNDIKLTDLLIEYTKKHQKKILNKVCKKLNALCKLTNNKQKIDTQIFDFAQKFEFSGDSQYFISRGEYLTAKIMAKYLNLKFIPAEKLIYFKNGNIDYKKINKKLIYYLKKYNKIVTSGFYGVENKKVKLFSRGGGDVSGAVISKAICADIYENYTDQFGIKQVNPNIVKNSNTIKMLSMTDCKIFCECDANVLHKDVCKILLDTKVKIKVKNILSPLKNYTTIDHKNHSCMFVCYKALDDYCQIVVRTDSVDCLKKFYDSINYISKKFVYICTAVKHLRAMIKRIYFCIAK